MQGDSSRGMKPYAAFSIEGAYKQPLEALLAGEGFQKKRGTWKSGLKQEGVSVRVYENGILSRLVMQAFFRFFGPGLQAHRTFAVAYTLMRQPASESERETLAEYLQRPLTPHYTQVIMKANEVEPARQVYDFIREYLSAQRAVFSDSRR